VATAHVQTKTAISNNTAALSVSLTGVGAGNHLTAGALVDATSSSLTTSTPSATWNNATNYNPVPGSVPIIRMDYSENVASGSWTVTLNQSSSTAITAMVSEASGVATSSSLGATPTTNDNTVTNSTTVQNTSLTPSAGSILYTVCEVNYNSGNSASSIDSGFTVRSDPSGGGGTCWDSSLYQPGGSASKDNVSTAALAPTWTAPIQCGNLATVLVEFKAPAVVPAAIVPPVVLSDNYRVAGWNSGWGR